MTTKALVVYFSYNPGNTRRIARFVQKALQRAGAQVDIEEIQTVTPYSSDYDTVVDQGQREVNEGFEPEIKPLVHNPEDYDIIVVGTPTWWYTAAPAVMTFLHAHQWAGKTVVPFQTTAGWPGTVLKDMSEAVPGAHIAASRRILFDATSREVLRTKQPALDAWAKDLAALVD